VASISPTACSWRSFTQRRAERLRSPVRSGAPRGRIRTGPTGRPRSPRQRCRGRATSAARPSRSPATTVAKRSPRRPHSVGRPKATTPFAVRPHNELATRPGPAPTSASRPRELTRLDNLVGRAGRRPGPRNAKRTTTRRRCHTTGRCPDSHPVARSRSSTSRAAATFGDDKDLASSKTMPSGTTARSQRPWTQIRAARRAANPAMIGCKDRGRTEPRHEPCRCATRITRASLPSYDSRPTRAPTAHALRLGHDDGAGPRGDPAARRRPPSSRCR